MNDLSKKKALPCVAKAPALKAGDLKKLFEQLDESWQLCEGSFLEKEYKFKNFKEALEFTNDIGKLAEEEGHHPDILLRYGNVKLKYWTHTVEGLTEADFVMAAKSDVCYVSRGY